MEQIKVNTIKNIVLNKKYLCFSIAIAVVAFMPFFILPLYSIDDYFLFQLPDINTTTLGYNFYSVGRFSQALVANCLSFFNLQPLTRPVGTLLFLFSLIYLGIVINECLNMRSGIAKMVVMIGIAVNPFNAEVLHYSIISFYSGLAVLFLALALSISHSVVNSKNYPFIFVAIFLFAVSLSFYQIFYPMVGLVIILVLIKEFKEKNHGSAFYFKALIFLLPYILGFLFYSLILKIAHKVAPPSLIYSGAEFIEIFEKIFTITYWDRISSNIYAYILKDNSFSSYNQNVLIILFSVVGVLFVSYSRKHLLCSIKNLSANMLLLLLFFLFGIVCSLGFSVLRPEPGEISGRVFMAFGLFQAGLIILPIILSPNKFYSNAILKKMFFLLAIILIFCNCSRYGKIALNQYRLNQNDRSLAIRITSRLESDPQFSPTARLCIFGSPELGSLAKTNIGDFNISSLQHFSKVFVINETSGYTFQQPNAEDMKQMSILSNKMGRWPANTSIIFEKGTFFIKL